LTLTLTSRRLGREIYRDTVATDLLEGSLLDFESGAFGSVEKLRFVVQIALSQTIDAALSKQGFLDVMRGEGLQPSS
jgi:phage-related holin